MGSSSVRSSPALSRESAPTGPAADHRKPETDDDTTPSEDTHPSAAVADLTAASG
jgi:hypothetical protein